MPDLIEHPRKLLRFADFELDPLSGELRRGESIVRLQPQPLKLLLALLQSPGELVTRDELHRKLMPEVAYGDFDHAINLAVSKLRAALRDSAENPQLIETLPRRGYRFLGHIELEEGGSRRPISPPERGFRQVRKLAGPRAIVAVLAALVVAALMASALYYRSREAKRLTDKDTIVIADFANKTGDAVFDDTLKTALTIALRQSPFLEVLSESKVVEILKLMTRPPDTKLTPEVTGELCQRANSKAYISGSIASMGNQYVVSLKAVNCQSGDTLGEEQVTAASKERVLNVLGKAAAKLRGRLGESLATLQKFDVPLREATTPSLEALQAYSLGVKVSREKGADAALAYYQRAIQLDPKFAMGYSAVAESLFAVGEFERANEHISKAYELRESASERESLGISGEYYDSTGELDKAARTYEELIKSYPRNAGAYIALAYVYTEQGQYESAAEVSRRCVQVDPNVVFGHEMVALSTIPLQRFDEARRAIREAHARKLDHYILHLQLYDLGFLAGDSLAMAQEQEWFSARPEFENNWLALAADSEAYAGHLSKSRELTRRSVDSAMRAHQKENGATWLENSAVVEAAFGNLAEARQTAGAGLKLAPANQGVGVEAALAYAMIGDAARAQSLAQDVSERYPLDTQMQALWLPAIRAQLALNRRNAAEALHHLQSALPPIEYGNVKYLNQTSCLVPTYIRGQAYLAAGQGTAAAAEFRKILGHSGIVLNCWTGALARLGVARANALQSKNSQGGEADAVRAHARAHARAAYKDFLALWKDGDPDIPIYKEAQAEYAKLQ